MGTLSLKDFIAPKKIFWIQTSGRSPPQEQTQPNATIVNENIYIFATNPEALTTSLLARAFVHESGEEYLQTSHPELSHEKRHALAQEVEKAFVDHYLRKNLRVSAAVRTRKGRLERAKKWRFSDTRDPNPWLPR